MFDRITQNRDAEFRQGNGAESDERIFAEVGGSERDGLLKGIGIDLDRMFCILGIVTRAAF